MLSAESAALVRATLPAVAGALDEITTRFYATMFHDRPELLDGMFNRGNQASGAPRTGLMNLDGIHLPDGPTGDQHRTGRAEGGQVGQGHPVPQRARESCTTCRTGTFRAVGSVGSSVASNTGSQGLGSRRVAGAQPRRVSGTRRLNTQAPAPDRSRSAPAVIDTPAPPPAEADGYEREPDGSRRLLG